MKDFCQYHGQLVITSGPAGDKEYLRCMSQREDVGQIRNKKGTNQEVRVCGKLPYDAATCNSYCPIAVEKRVEISIQGD